MLVIPEIVSIGVLCFAAAFVVFMLISPERTKSFLSYDIQGVLVFALCAAIMLGVWYFNIRGEWVIALVAIGSFIAGCALIVGLPNPISDKLIARQNIGYILILVGLWIVFYYTLAPSWRNVVQAFDIIWKHTKMSQGLILIGGAILVSIGILISKGKRST